jgi:hypothetical protein
MIRSRLCAAVLSVSLLFGTACRVHLTPSQIAALLTTLQAEVNALPNVPPAVSIALDTAQKAIAADASGSKWPAIARIALTTVYQDLPAADQDNPAILATVMALELALDVVGA